MKRLLGAGVGGFVVASDAGERWALSLGERKQLLEWTVRDSDGAPVVVDLSSGSTSASLDLAQHASRHGAFAAIVRPLLYPALTLEETTDFLQTLQRHGNIQLVFLCNDSIAQEISERFPTQHGVEILVGDTQRTSDFRAGSFWASTWACLGAREVSASQSLLLETVGPARLLKFAFPEQEVEVGPLRGPLQMPAESLQQSVREELFVLWG